MPANYMKKHHQRKNEKLMGDLSNTETYVKPMTFQQFLEMCRNETQSEGDN